MSNIPFICILISLLLSACLPPFFAPETATPSPMPPPVLDYALNPNESLFLADFKLPNYYDEELFIGASVPYVTEYMDEAGITQEGLVIGLSILPPVENPLSGEPRENISAHVGQILENNHCHIRVIDIVERGFIDERPLGFVVLGITELR